MTARGGVGDSDAPTADSGEKVLANPKRIQVPGLRSGVDPWTAEQDPATTPADADRRPDFEM